MALLGAVTAYLLAADRSAQTRYPTLAVALAGCVVVLIVAASRANAAARAMRQRINGATHGMQEWIDDLRSSMARGQEEIQRLVAQVHRGERPVPRRPPTAPAPGSHPFTVLAYGLEQVQRAAEVAVVETTDLAFGGDSDQRVAVFVNFARRLQSLIHRAIQKLDELENQVEDPDLLKGLFFVDHLATGVRRQAESLSVLGGAVSRRQWSNPVAMYSVLRSAVAEIEQYARVKVVPPIEGTLRGHAVADIIHLIAELVENATSFSAPETHVRLSAQPVTAGLAIEVEDRGLGMPIEDQRRMNDLLAAPRDIDLGELLKDGRIGLCVVSALARRHGVVVRLRANIYGGTDAVVVLPGRLLGDESQDHEPDRLSQPAPREPISAVAANVQEAVQASAPPPGSAFAPPSSGTLLPAANHSKVRGPSAAPIEQYGPYGRPGGEPPSAPGAWGPAQPMPEHRRSRPLPEPTPSANGPASHHPAGDGARPQLPKRRKAEHLPGLFQDRAGPNEPMAGHDPGLMAAFQQGISRGIDEADSPTGHTDRAN
jgi:signal transduction histidine kinase